MIRIPSRTAPALAAIAFAFLAWTPVQAAEEVPEIESAVPEDMTRVEEYMFTMNLVDGLGVYNQQLQQLLADQRREIATIEGSVERISTMRRQLGPLTERMILSLEQFIELDLPFKIESRRGMIAELKDLMGRVDVSTAEKFRRVVEAYQEEIEYGNTHEAYADFIEIEGRGRQVDVLRMGRALLAFQTIDGQVTGVWDSTSDQWKILGPEYANGVRDGLRMARKTMTPDLVLLPVPAPE